LAQKVETGVALYELLKMPPQQTLRTLNKMSPITT
jgi:hypothetical protein